MMIQHFIFNLRKLILVWFGVVAGLSLISGCGGGGSGKSASNAPPVNQNPTVSISSPTGTYFKEGENIVFTASASDPEDGQLTGSSLVWTSSKDGTLGAGDTLITSALTSGDQDITLTATDSEGASTVASISINIAKTRFIKMGFQTTGVPDASNAFDGDEDTAATIMTPDTEIIHFKAYLGIADTFFFKIKVGASTAGSRLAVQALTTVGAWQPISDIPLDADKTVDVKVINAQDYEDADGNINLRARWEGGASGDVASIYEIWRVDPVYNGPDTMGITNPELAFDGDPTTGAVISIPWDGTGNSPSLNFKAYVGTNGTSSFIFSLSHNKIGNFQSIAIEIEDPAGTGSNRWVPLQDYPLDTATTRTVIVSDVQKYLDADGYISLRAYWVGFGSSSQLEVYDILRIDPLFIGLKTNKWIDHPEYAIDGMPGTFATISYYWGELDHYDFLHVQAYLGDTLDFTFSLQAGLSSPAPGAGYALIVEGEIEPDSWSPIKRIDFENTIDTIIALPNARQYIDADGFLNLRVRWESDSGLLDTYVYEISQI